MARLCCLPVLLSVLVMMSGVNGESPIELPQLPDDPLQINVEATIYRKNLTSGEMREYTTYFEEYRDIINNRGLTIQLSNSTETRYYYDLEDKQGFTLTRHLTTTPLYQAECTTTNFSGSDGTSGSSRFGGFRISKHNGRYIISNISDFFQWSSFRSPIALGSDTVRGISATKWQIPVTTTVGSDTMTYNLTYYFSDGHAMPYYGTRPVPLRLEMTGTSDSSLTGSHTFNHVYDFNLIAPLGEKSENFFATPKGVFCPNRVAPMNSKHIPADQYSLSQEVVDMQKKTVHNNRIYLDFSLNLTRTDYQFEKDDSSVYGNTSVKILHDFTYNYQMVINKDTGSCNITRIPTTGMTSWDVTTDSNGSPVLIHTKDLIAGFSYQGTRTEKGVLVDVWSRKDINRNNTVEINEIWFTHKSHSLLESVQNNAFDQFYGPLQSDGNLTNDAFDISECYRKDAISSEHLGFLLQDPEMLYAKGKITINALTRAIRGHISGLALVSPSRITNIEVYEASSKSATILKVFFILRAKVLLSDSSLSELIADEAENAQVLTMLEIKLATPGGQEMMITATDGHKSMMVVASLLSNDEGDVAEEIADNKGSATPPTYTSASMAGLGIGMLLLGAILTIGVGAILWIKRFDINLPYLAQTNE